MWCPHLHHTHTPLTKAWRWAPKHVKLPAFSWAAEDAHVLTARFDAAGWLYHIWSLAFVSWKWSVSWDHDTPITNDTKCRETAWPFCLVILPNSINPNCFGTMFLNYLISPHDHSFCNLNILRMHPISNSSWSLSLNAHLQFDLSNLRLYLPKRKPSDCFSPRPETSRRNSKNSAKTWKLDRIWQNDRLQNPCFPKFHQW